MRESVLPISGRVCWWNINQRPSYRKRLNPFGRRSCWTCASRGRKRDTRVRISWSFRLFFIENGNEKKKIFRGARREFIEKNNNGRRMNLNNILGNSIVFYEENCWTRWMRVCRENIGGGNFYKIWEVKGMENYAMTEQSGESFNVLVNFEQWTPFVTRGAIWITETDEVWIIFKSVSSSWKWEEG